MAREWRECSSGTSEPLEYLDVSSVMIVVMASVAVGFLMIAGAFASFSYGKPAGLTWGLGIGALITVTVIPTVLAVFVAA